MPNVGLITIEKVFAGEPFLNTYALQNGVFNDAPLNNADLTAFVGPGVTSFSDGFTDPNDPLYGVVDSPLAGVIGFDRMMTAAAVGYTRIYISDGKTPGVPTGAFATFPLAFGGLALTSTGPEDVAPLNIALQVNRAPNGFSQRQGRLQLRAALAKGEIEPFSRDGVSIKTTVLANVNARLVEALSQSEINTRLFTPPAGADDVHLVIPKYRPKNHADKGAIFAASDIGGFVLGDAISRQVQRGRKQTPAT